MAEVTTSELIKKAKKVARLHKISEDVIVGHVGCALVTDKGNTYVGINIHAACGIGFCAEHSAIAAMVTNREYRIKKIVAVSCNGTILPPCGRCRELMYQIDEHNWNSEVVIGKSKIVRLKDLLPDPWQKRLFAKKIVWNHHFVRK
jgi:cytidine deaminase